MAKTQDQELPSTDVSASFLSSTYIRALLVLISVVGVTGYLFRETIAEFVLSIWSQVWHGVIGTLGLGLLPIALWTVLFAFAIYRRRWLFRYLNIWAASFVLLALILALLSYYRPLLGLPAVFTLHGEVTLGGIVGEAIRGPVMWVGVLRLVGLSVLMTALAAPQFALDASLRVTRIVRAASLGSYVLIVVGVKSITRMYKPRTKESEPAFQALDTSTAVTLYNRSDSLAAIDSSGSGSLTAVPVTAVRSAPVEELVSLEDVDEDFDSRATELKEDGVLLLDALRENDNSEIVVGDEAVDDFDGQAVDDAKPESWRDSDTLDDDSDPEGDELTDQAPEIIDTGFEALSDEGDDDLDQVESDESLDLDDAPEYDDTDDDTEQDPLADMLIVEEPRQWETPPIHLLQELPEGGVTRDEMLETAETIRRTLADYGVEVEVGQIRPGPTVTMYGLIPGWVRRYKQVKSIDDNGRPILNENGKPTYTRLEQKTRVKVDNILAREKDLALALKTPSIRIETPVMGKSQVGIEVPNPKPSIVTLRSVMESPEFAELKPKAHLPIAFGKGSGGETVVVDLAKMPHLLIAGATGSGKSVCLNTIVSCLITEKTPAELRMLLIDPKRVELTPFNGIPHLLSPVVVDTDKVVGLLKGVIREMLERYRLMEDLGVRNIEAYNKKSDEKMPFLVVVVDELADLMMSAAFDIEHSLCRLAQLGRATGIHLIVATQRPSVDVVTGLIKANFPSRISFAVTSQVDSRTILDSAGADKLLGKGDMLYLPIDGSRPSRVQGVFISDNEIENLVNYWQTTPWLSIRRMDLRTMADDDGESDEGTDLQSSTDELFDKAIGLAQTHNKLSTSLLQRRLRIGYPRAARLMDELEDQGVVGPGDGSKSRDVIISKA